MRLLFFQEVLQQLIVMKLPNIVTISRQPESGKITLLYSTLLYSTLLYSTLLYSTLLYSTLPYPTLPYPTLPYPTLPYPTLPYSTLLYSTLRYATLRYSTLLSFTVVEPFCTIRCVLHPYGGNPKARFILLTPSVSDKYCRRRLPPAAVDAVAESR